MTSAPDAKRVCEAACAALTELAGAPGAAVVLWANGDAERAGAAVGLASGLEAAVEECARGVLVDRPARAAAIDDAASLPEGAARAALLAAGVGSVCLAPVSSHGSLVGVAAVLRAEAGPMGDGVVATAASVAAATGEAADRLRREAALRAERDLLAAGPLVVFRWRNAPGWPVAYVSPNAESVFGVPAADFMSGRVPYASVIHPEDAPRVLGAASGATPGEGLLDQRYRVVRPDGRVVSVRDLTRVVRDDSGRVTHHDGYILALGDSGVVEPAAPLWESPAEDGGLEAAERLAGGLAHEFNNLLTAIGGSAARALDRLAADSENRGDVERIVGAVERAAALTRKLLVISGQQVSSPRLLDLSAVVRAGEPVLRLRLWPGVRWHAELAAGLWPVRADAAQVEEALACLVANAGEAMGPAGVLTIRTANAAAPASAGLGPAVLVEVHDTGPGMDAPTLARLREPFFTTKPSAAGVGLGLATARAIAHRWGGRLRVESAPGRGTTASLLWPRAEAAPGPDAGAPRGGETILLAEDHDLVRRIMAAMLRDLGYTVLEAEDGPAAVRCAGANPGPIHLLITDAIMPGMAGVEVAATLRRTRPGLRTLVVSGYAEEEPLRRGVERGELHFLAKPFTPDELGRAVRRALDSPPPPGPAPG